MSNLTPQIVVAVRGEGIKDRYVKSGMQNLVVSDLGKLTNCCANCAGVAAQLENT